jgi:hypothetical protein
LLITPLRHCAIVDDAAITYADDFAMPPLLTFLSLPFHFQAIIIIAIFTPHYAITFMPLRQRYAYPLLPLAPFSFRRCRFRHYFDIFISLRHLIDRLMLIDAISLTPLLPLLLRH